MLCVSCVKPRPSPSVTLGMNITAHPALGPHTLVTKRYRVAIIRGARGRRILYVEHRVSLRWRTLPLV